LSKQHDEESEASERRGRSRRAEEIASALRESAATPAALARRREQQLLTTLRNLMESADNREIFVERVRETFKLRENDPRWKAILAVWDKHLNPWRRP